MLDSNPAWVAVMTHSGAENLVAERFRKTEPPIECYLPMMVTKDRRYKKKPQQEKPMFPGYLFARINNKQVYPTRTTRGVIYIVSSQHSIIQVPESEIEAIRAFEATQRKIFIHETAQLVRGAEAVIKAGEFAGMRGRLIKGCKDGNFSVSISVMNASFVVHLKRFELQPVPSSDDIAN